jgi:hypothetical protein
MSLLLRYFNLPRFQLLTGIILVNLILVWLSKTYLINEVVFYNAYSEYLTYDRALKLFEDFKSISWVGYAFTPVILLLKVSFISIVIYSGIILYNLKSKISLGEVFRIVIASEIIFVFAGLAKFLWFFLFAGNYDLTELGFFYPASLINFFRPNEVSRLWIYPMQMMNLFHIIYIILLAYGLNKVCSIDKADSEKVVLSSYLPALIFWITIIMFLTVDKQA